LSERSTVAHPCGTTPPGQPTVTASRL
jgi:hypothetical protein